VIPLSLHRQEILTPPRGGGRTSIDRLSVPPSQPATGVTQVHQVTDSFHHISTR